MIQEQLQCLTCISHVCVDTGATLDLKVVFKNELKCKG